jgi:hypothetical protein
MSTIENIRICHSRGDERPFDEFGNKLTPPEGWAFLPAGDAGITRKVTAKKQYWKVVFKKGRRTMSKGVWAPADIIEAAKGEVTALRETDEYKTKLEKGRAYRARKEEEYKLEFFEAVRSFLAFDKRYKDMEELLAHRVTEHAVPVGSGTVARTEMIPLAERASRAVIAWIRHQTTAYDNMVIPRIKGKRRETRRELAEISRALLESYRRGENGDPRCPLKIALSTVKQC